MRIEMKDENQEEIKPIDRDKLENKYESDLTRKEKRELEREKLKDMTLKQRFEYFFAYYKSWIVAVVVVIVVICMGVDIYHNSQIETILSLFIVSGTAEDSVADDVKAMLGSEEKLEEVFVSTNLQCNETFDGFEYNSQMVFVAQVSAREVDILIMPEKIYENLKPQEYFLDLHDVLGEDGYEAMGDLVDGDCVRVDASLLEKQNITTFYDDVCIAVIGNSEHLENAATWLLNLAAQA